MRRLPVATLALATALTACGGDAPAADLEPLADQADRVGRLIDEGRGCDAVEALGELRTLAEQDAPAEVREAVVGFASSAEQSVTCDPPPADPGPEPEPQDDEARPEDEGDDEDEDKPGRGKGRDKDDDSEDSDD